MKSSPTNPRSKRWTPPAGVVVSGAREVNRYLSAHPDMAAIVPAMCRRAREEFGSTAALTIQINQDREMDDPYLVLLVRQPSYAADARQRMDAIWQHFENELRELSGWIIVTTDFRRVKSDGV